MEKFPKTKISQLFYPPEVEKARQERLREKIPRGPTLETLRTSIGDDVGGIYREESVSAATTCPKSVGSTKHKIQYWHWQKYQKEKFARENCKTPTHQTSPCKTPTHQMSPCKTPTHQISPCKTPTHQTSPDEARRKSRLNVDQLNSHPRWNKIPDIIIN